MGETLATTLTALVSVSTTAMTGVGTVVEKITSTPLLFIPFGLSLTYSFIRITKRLFH